MHLYIKICFLFSSSFSSLAFVFRNMIQVKSAELRLYICHHDADADADDGTRSRDSIIYSDLLC